MTDTLDIWKDLELSGFFAFMRKKLKEREYKNFEWKKIEDIPIQYLFNHLKDELEEFKLSTNFENTKEEVCDIANLCGMIFIVSNKLQKISLKLEPIFRDDKNE